MVVSIIKLISLILIGLYLSICIVIHSMGWDDEKKMESDLDRIYNRYILPRQFKKAIKSMSDSERKDWELNMLLELQIYSLKHGDIESYKKSVKAYHDIKHS